MKQIKKIVLKDATKLTSSEMKKIRGGIEPEYSQTCSAVCYTSTGAMLGSLEHECYRYENAYCDIVSGAVPTTLACFRFNPDNIVTDPIDWSEKSCLDEYENYI